MSETRIKITISAAAKGLSGTFGKGSKALRAFRSEMGLTRTATLSLGNTMKTAFAGVGLGLATRALFQAAVQAQSLNSAFESIAGSGAAAKDELSFIRGTADRLGQEFYSVADAYKGIFASAKGTGLQGEGVRNLFVSINEAATALGTKSEAVNRAFLQISQGISRGRFELEDLKTISEALPGVGMNDFAKSLGVTTAEFLKMVSAGQVLADDFLPKLSKVLHEKFGDAAVLASENAIAAFNRFQTAWMDIKVAVANSGFLEQATGYLKSLAETMKDPAVQAAIKAWAERFFELTDSVVKFVIEHGKVLAMLAAAGIILPKLIGLWKGLNAAMAVMTGMRLAPYLVSVNAAMSGLIGTTITLGAVVTTLVASLAALAAGYKLGEWLTMQGHMKGIADETDRLNRYTSETSKKFLEISRATGVTVTSMEELDQAVKDGKIRWDELTSEWKKGAGEQAAAVKQSAAEQKAVTSEALKAMEAQYKKYTAEVKRLQDEIAGRERSLQEQLRAMGRSGMSDIGAWRDRKKEANEYYNAAKRAAAAGNFEEAVALADKAKEAYKDLNKEVKSGDKVQVSSQKALKTSMTGVESAGKLAISILEKQKTAAEEAAKALDDKSGGKLSGVYDEALKKQQQLSDEIKKSGGEWGKVWDSMERDARSAINASEQRIVKLTRDRNVTVYIKEVVKKAIGGPIGRFATGGKLSGYGGGDRIHALLEAGEFIIRKEAVSKFGNGIFHALNSLQLPKFAAGGAVGAAAGGGAVYQLDLRLTDGPAVRVQTNQNGLAELQRQMVEQQRFASS